MKIRKKRELVLVLTLTLTTGIIPESVINIHSKEGIIEADFNEEINVRTPEILTELEELRDEYSRTYFRSDGKNVQIVFGVPVNSYNEEDGSWEDIGAISENKDGITTCVSEYTNIAMEIDSDSVTGNSLDTMIIEDNSNIQISLENVERNTKLNTEEIHDTEINVRGMKPEQIASGVLANLEMEQIITFENVYPNTDVSYVINEGNCKENIILSQYNGKDSYTYEINAEDYEIVLNQDGSVDFKNNDEIKWSIPVAYMYDSAGNTSYDIKPSIVKKDEAYELTYNVDTEWLKSNEREYPVTIDPTLSKEGAGGVSDTYTNDNNNAYSYGENGRVRS